MTAAGRAVIFINADALAAADACAAEDEGCVEGVGWLAIMVFTSCSLTDFV